MLLALSLLVGWTGSSLAISAVKGFTFSSLMRGEWGVFPNDPNLNPSGPSPDNAIPGKPYPAPIGPHSNNPNTQPYSPSGTWQFDSLPYTPTPPVPYV
jgi:hypothetical protein